MSNRSQQVITLDSVSALNNTSDSLSSASPGSNKDKPIVWKDLGVYLDKKLSIDIRSNDQAPVPELSQVVKYKICKSCQRPIGVESLPNHYNKCVEMRNKKQANNDQPSAIKQDLEDDVPIKKRKSKLMDMEPSSVDSSRNGTPAPNTPSSNNNNTTAGGRPKKKYKKSQTQKEKEAANAAAAAAAAAANNGGSSTADRSHNSKKKKQPKQQKSTAKQKGPVDVEKQCGVPLPNGGYCARSLTCKTHSMGAKRMVPGRSAPYDVLLQQYQKRNQAKLAANNALAMQQKEQEELNNVNNENDVNANKYLDPDEETYLVLEGLSRNQPIPLERKLVVPNRNRHRFLYMRESYANALIINNNSQSNSGNSGNSGEQTSLANQAISGSIGGLQGRCALVNVDSARVENDSLTQASANIPGEMYQVRAPSKEVLMTAQQNAMQQQMFQQQVMRLQQQQLLMRQRQKQMQQLSQQPVQAQSQLQ